MESEILEMDCVKYLRESSAKCFDLTFLDPPFNQDKDYNNHNDSMEPSEYWKWMKEVCQLIYSRTKKGGAIYFMQREKNTKNVLDVLESSGWTFQNLIVWKKKTSAVPGAIRYGKHYQIIAYFTKGKSPRVFNRLRINPPLLVTEKYQRSNGVYLTDVWDDIRELTSGYYAGDEPFRNENGDRLHKQQSPIRLLARIILSSTNVGDTILDPFAGTGTTLVVAKQLERNSIGIETDLDNIHLVKNRISKIRIADRISKFRNDYIHTENLEGIWPHSLTQKPLNFEYQER
jgi:site-specific DNA-methyltransferase (adenine-specific)